MDDPSVGFNDDDAGWIAIAAHPEPVPSPEPPPKPRCPEARRALAWAILGFVCLGFVFGPLAIALGHRARLAQVEAPELGDAGMTRAAMAIGKVGMALHLAIVITAAPWLLFALPLVGF
jgi:hypothetical protein